MLEYIEGSPIQGPMTEADAVRAALQIAAALEAAHAKGILHRDLKPGNILMTAAGAKLLDFGLAKLVSDDQATLTIGVSGTPLYMSPEQAEGKTLDARSDVFSFGAVLYELLAGRRAFDSLAAVLRDEPAPLTSPASRHCQPVSRQATGATVSNHDGRKDSAHGDRRACPTRGTTLHRRAALRQHERRQGERIFLATAWRKKSSTR